MTSSEVSFAHQNNIYLFLLVGDENGDGVCGNDENASQAQTDATNAVSAARNLGAPAGVVLYKDFEAGCSDPTSAYISEWYSIVHGSGYEPGFYGNSNPGQSFPGAYCGVNTTGFQWYTTLYATEPEPGPYGGPGSAPAWNPASPDCSNTTDLWQYDEGSTFDVDEAQPFIPGMWGPNGGVTSVWQPGAAVNPQNNDQYVFWRGPDSDIHEAWYGGGKWNGPENVTTTYGWGANAMTAPGVGVTNNEDQHVFWRGPDGDIWESWHTTQWNGPTDMTTTYGWPQATSATGVAVDPSDNDQYVFWRATDGDMYEAWYGGGTWHAPINMTSEHGWGQPSSAPGVAVADDESQYVFWLDTAGNVWEAYHYTSWGGPTDMSSTYSWGTASSPPGVGVDPSDDDQYVFWRGADGDTHEGWYQGSQWNGPTDVTSTYGWGSQPSSGPGLGVTNNEDQYVFWRGPDGDVWESWHTTHWNGPTDMTTTYGWK